MTTEEYPKLLEQAENCYHHLHSEEFGLDDVIRAILHSSKCPHNDFVEGGEFETYARDLIRTLDRNPLRIQRRQRVLDEFLKNQDLIESVRKVSIPSLGHYYDRSCRFYKDIDIAKGYRDSIVSLLSGLAATVSNDEFLRLGRHLADVRGSQRLKDLESALEDIEKPVLLQVRAELGPKHSYYSSEYVMFSGLNQIAIFSSGKTAEYNPGCIPKDLKFPTEQIVLGVLNQVEKKDKVDLHKKDIPASLELDVDERTGKVNASVRYKRFSWKESFKSGFRRKYVDVVTDFELSNVQAKDFTEVTRRIKEQAYHDFLYTFRDDSRRFGKAVVELRYLEACANYFSEMEKRGYESNFPDVSVGDKVLKARDLVEPNLARNTKRELVVANDVDSDSNKNLFVITGPNNNGKTTYMNSIAIAQTMAQAGLKVFARDKPEFSVRDQISVHYIQPGDIVLGESRYAHELSRIRDVFQYSTDNSLILVDEPFSGTSPEDGQRQAIDVVRALGRLGATTFVATHFHGLIDVARELPYARNLYCVADVDDGDLTYTYKIAEGYSRKSNGIYLARKLGADGKSLNEILDGRATAGVIKLRGGSR